MFSDDPIKAKLILLGSAAVGKTTIIQVFLGNGMDPAVSPTIFSMFTSYLARASNGQEVNLAIWDTAGQEVYRSLAPSYYRDAQLILLVFSVTDKESFNSLQKWINDIQENNPSSSILLCGNKIDLVADRVISSEDIQSFAQKNELPYIEVSGKTGENIDYAFQHLIDSVATSETPESVIISDETHQKPQSEDKWCC